MSIKATCSGPDFLPRFLRLSFEKNTKLLLDHREQTGVEAGLLLIAGMHEPTNIE